MNSLLTPLLVTTAVLLSGCHNRVNVEKEKAAIMAIHETVRQAHLDHDATKFLSHNAEQWLSVRDGSVSLRNKEQTLKDLDQYLKSVDFREVVDVTPPEIKISEDGSMAWLIGNVRVSGTQQQPNGGHTEVSFISTWLSVYEKRGSDWYLVATATTEKRNS